MRKLDGDRQTSGKAKLNLNSLNPGEIVKMADSETIVTTTTTTAAEQLFSTYSSSITAHGPNLISTNSVPGTSIVTVKGGGQVQISERNPFRGLVGSMNVAIYGDNYNVITTTNTTTTNSTGGLSAYNYSSITTTTSTSLLHDSPPDSKHRFYLDHRAQQQQQQSRTNINITAPPSWVSSSTISNSSGSSGSSVGGAGRILPSTLSATRTISAYSSNTNSFSQIKVPPGSTGPSVLNSTDPTTSTTDGSSLNRYSLYSSATSSCDSTTSAPPASSSYHYHYEPSSTVTSSYLLTDSSSVTSTTISITAPYHRMYHTMSSSTACDAMGSSTRTSTRPYYSSYLSSTTTTTSASNSSVVPLSDPTSPSKRTTITSSYLTYNSTGSGSEAIYSTVNKSSRTSNTDLSLSSYIAGSSISKFTTRGETSSYGHRRDVLNNNNDADNIVPSKYRVGESGVSSTDTKSTGGGTIYSWSASMSPEVAPSSSGLLMYQATTKLNDLSSSLASKSATARISYPMTENYVSIGNKSNIFESTQQSNISSTIGLYSTSSSSLAFTSVGGDSSPLIKPLIGGSGSLHSSSIYPSKFKLSNTTTCGSSSSYLYSLSSSSGSGGEMNNTSSTKDYSKNLSANGLTGTSKSTSYQSDSSYRSSSYI